ncbi:primosomal replication protein PriC [Colwellia sp. E2M01]|uniref:primosomal replication protein PriC n=1 Tax=Colwellia sp. E2M01 TaxID=2841561 RepID=UPI001C0A5495|nr:primosomal replication protein PriC [Colwellia sp. E2M01]MBU2871319.1 primosomal replication protein [Colwellia sp. E2M01]
MSNLRYEAAINRLSTLLEHLFIEAQATDERNSKQKSHRLIENNNLFSPHLFTTQSDKICEYVNETKAKLIEFSRLYNTSADNANKVEFAKLSLVKIEQQISGLMNAIQANQPMHQAAQISFDARKKVKQKATQVQKSEQYNKLAKAVLLSSHQLYQQLAEHHEFERRLMDMVAEREQQRIKTKSANNDKLSQEVLALHQRLGRCRKAISTIERNIELAEKNNLR